MMNIQLRKNFDSVNEDGCLESQIYLPTRPAIYTLRLRHLRPGLSLLNAEQKILVRPKRHDEYARFLPVAWPYYVSWLSVLVATYLVLVPTLLLRRSVK